MKRNKFWNRMVLLICVFAVLLAGCGKVEKEDLIGVWSGFWEYEGVNIDVAVELENSGDYYEVTYRDGELAKTESGTYVIDGNKVTLNDDQMGHTEYKYSGGKLNNGGHALSKESE